MKAFRRSSVLSLLMVALLLQGVSFAQRTKSGQKRVVKPVSTAKAKKPVKRVSSNAATQPKADSVDPEKVSQSIGVICSERTKDPLASTPIDVMQAKASISLNHPDSLSGTARAKRLLPATREFVIKAIQELGKKHNIPQWRLNLAAERIQKVTKIKPDPDLRDNASVTLSEPDTISFGTIFLVGLPSEEGMISVLSHEMVHLGDGRQNTLQLLFRAIGARATASLGMRITGQRAEELTCDLIGVMVARYLIESKPNHDALTRRLARSLQHNCVSEDDTDDDHLSPRTTMRAVLSLDPMLLRDLLSNAPTTSTIGNKRHRQDVFFSLGQGTSLTISRSDSYHHPSR